MLRNILKTFCITLILLSIGLSDNNKNTLLNLKVKIDSQFRQNLQMDPNLYKIWIGTTDGSEQLSAPILNERKAKTYIPGLPGSAPLEEKVYTTGKVSQIFNYIVDIYIDDSYDTLYKKNQIKGVILDIWPAFGKGSRLEDNVNIKVMSFQAPSGSEEESSELQKLEENQRNLENALAKLENDYLDKVNELEEKNASKASLESQILELTKQIEVEQEEKRFKKLENDLQILKQELDSVRAELQEEKDVKNAQNIEREMLIESFEQKRAEATSLELEKQAEEIESLKASILNSELALDDNIQLRLKYLEGQFTKTQRFKDSLLNRMGSQLDKINFPEPIVDTVENDSMSQNGESASNTGWVLWLAIGLLGLLIILSLVAIFTNKKKVIYLKPKDQKTAEPTKESTKEQSADIEQKNIPPAPVQVAQTYAPVDEGVMQSEIRTQRQSAVAMSAGQKEGATQIVKDWLEESKNEENSEE